ncbi:MAG: hypothetical protein HY303_05735, partial [Candidatus Wallbacteria bacterium]|nr:hypothetical protein [Candidatus Wallbacteria bacterium]
MRALTFATLLLAIAALPARAQFSAQGNPFGQPGTAGQATRESGASGSKSGLENSRSFVLGPLGTPGHWEIKGDGSGPIMIGDQVYIPGGPGQKGQFVDTGTSLDAKIIGTSGGGGGGGSGTIRSSR